MSEMVRHKGVIKRISTKETARKVYDELVMDGKIDGKFADFDKDGNPIYLDTDDYVIVDGCIFNALGAPGEYDTDESVEEAERLNETDYRIHAYFYNGGGSFDEILEEIIPEADKEYGAKHKHTFWAIKLVKSDNYFVKNSSVPALYKTKEKAEKAIDRYWPGISKDIYEAVQFGEI